VRYSHRELEGFVMQGEDFRQRFRPDEHRL
jgi:hypothetical protein